MRCGAIQSAASFFILIIFFLLPLSKAVAEAPGGDCSVDQLLIKAEEKKLYDDRYWKILLHYRDQTISVESQIDDPAFFLAKDGKTNPRSELIATIRTLFCADTQEAMPYICKFYGRFVWLKEELGLGPEIFADRVCPEIDQISPRTVYLVFPSYYMNNPSTMFSHTLLTIDTGYTSKRLSNAINYAAYTEGRTGMSFALRGLVGLFKGYYTVMPYYKKIQDYADINQRDIWEYELNLTPDEIRRMLRHIKELDLIYTDYYFFDENCSYNILFLLEAARPTLHLTDQFFLAIIPIDTVQVIEKAGLIEGSSYRPAKATRIRYQMSVMNKEDIDTALAVAHGKKTPEDILNLPIYPPRKIRILDLAVDTIQYRFVKEDIDKKGYQQEVLAALAARSRLGQSETDIDAQIPAPQNPLEGHKSRRISLGAGIENGDPFIDTRIRPAMTDLVDMDYIQNQGAQIEFCDVRGRYYPEDDRFALEKFDVLDIVSICPRDEFFKPFSWKFNTGLHRKPMEDGENKLYYRLNAGGGLGERYPYLGLCYAMVESEADAGGRLDDNYALGAGGEAGTIFTLSPLWKARLYGRAVRFALGDSHADYSAGLVNNLRVTQNNQVSLELAWEKSHAKSISQMEMLWHFYY